MPETPMERLKRMAGKNKPVELENPPSFELLKKDAEIKGNIEPKKTKGGARVGAGRKPKESTAINRATKAKVDELIHGDVRVEVTDPKTGKSFIIKKPRAVRVAESLYKEAVENGNVAAQREFLNRAVGKVPDAVERGDPNKPVRVIVDF